MCSVINMYLGRYIGIAKKKILVVVIYNILWWYQDTIFLVVPRYFLYEAQQLISSFHTFYKSALINNNL